VTPHANLAILLTPKAMNGTSYSGAIHLQDLLLILSYHCPEAVVVENGAYIELMGH
jgi:hypothetical protein